MEYFLTNMAISQAEPSTIHYQGDFSQAKSNLILQEGYFAKSQFDAATPDQIFAAQPDGIYNYICYDKEKQVISIINDKLGKMPLYYYVNGGNFCISNQVWQIIKCLGKHTKIDKPRLRDHLYYFTIPSESATYIKGLKRLPAASIFRLDLNRMEYQVDKYWHFQYQFSQEKEDLESALDQFDRDLHTLFDRIQELHPRQKIGFGNSGGLDSRLVAIYGKEHGLDLHGFTICNKQSKLGLQSVSYQNATRIAEYFGFPNQIVDFRPTDYTTRILLDVRNNPFGIAQFFKNAYSKIPDLDILITGQQGAMVGDHWGNYLEREDQDYIARYFKFYYERHRDLKNRIAKLIGKILDSDGIYNNSSILNKIVQPGKDRIKDYLDSTKLSDFANQYMYFYQNILSRYGYNGGFESINRTLKTYYLYYPQVFTSSLLWNRNFFYKRLLLKKLIARKSSFLANLRDTQLNKVVGQDNLLKRVAKRIELKLRTTGVHFPSWVQDPKYIERYKTIIMRPNPLFDEVIDKAQLLKHKVYYNMNTGGDFLKTKMVLDIIHYQEFDKLDQIALKIQ